MTSEIILYLLTVLSNRSRYQVASIIQSDGTAKLPVYSLHYYFTGLAECMTMMLKCDTRSEIEQLFFRGYCQNDLQHETWRGVIVSDQVVKDVFLTDYN